MNLIRSFARSEKDGKIKIPGNIIRSAGLKEGQLVELKITGALKKKNIIISGRDNT